jgi:hypothetical protein
VQADAILRGAVLTGLWILGGCGECDAPLPSSPGVDADDDTPRLLSGRFLRGDLVELAFSDPIAPVDDVDPRSFRLSIARGNVGRDYGVCYTETYYCDPALGFSLFGCRGCAALDDDCPAPATVIDLANDPDDATHLQLRLSAGIDPLRCLELQYYAPRAAILAHYSTREIPVVSGRSGEPLADIASHWASTDERKIKRDGTFPDLDAFVPLPCPDDF